MDLEYLQRLMGEEEAVVEEAAGGAGGIWTVAEIEVGELTPLSLALVGKAREWGDALGTYVRVALLGAPEGAEGGSHRPYADLAGDLIAAGADTVHWIADPALSGYPLEPTLHALTTLFDERRPEFILLGATAANENLAPRLTQRLGTALLANCVAIRLDEVERVLIGHRPAYEGEYYEVVVAPQAQPQIATVQPEALAEPYLDRSRSGGVEEVLLSLEEVTPRIRPVGAVSVDLPPVPLRRARRIVAGGRDVGNFGLVERLAGMLGAHVAGDRGAWHEGWIEEEQVIGLTGARVAPDLYVACGIRGDTAHLFGIQDARFVVAIHPDPTAPIFQAADLGLVADPQEALPALIEALSS